MIGQPDIKLMERFGNEQVYLDKQAGVPGLMRILWGLGAMDQSVRHSNRELMQKREAARLNAIFQELEMERMAPAIEGARGASLPSLARRQSGPAAEHIFPAFPYREQYSPSPDEGMTRISMALGNVAALMARQDVELLKSAGIGGTAASELAAPITGAVKKLTGAFKAPMATAATSIAKAPSIKGPGAALNIRRGAAVAQPIQGPTSAMKSGPHFIGAASPKPMTPTGVNAKYEAKALNQAAKRNAAGEGGGVLEPGQSSVNLNPQHAAEHKLFMQSGGDYNKYLEARKNLGAPPSAANSNAAPKPAAPVNREAATGNLGPGPASHIRNGSAYGPDGTRVVTAPLAKPAPQPAPTPVSQPTKPATGGQPQVAAPPQPKPAAEAAPQQPQPPASANTPQPSAPVQPSVQPPAPTPPPPKPATVAPPTAGAAVAPPPVAAPPPPTVTPPTFNAGGGTPPMPPVPPPVPLVAQAEGMVPRVAAPAPDLLGKAQLPRAPSPVRASAGMMDTPAPTAPTVKAAPAGMVEASPTLASNGGGGGGTTPPSNPTVEAPAAKSKPLISTKHKIMAGAGLALAAPALLAYKGIDTAGKVLGSEPMGPQMYGTSAAPMANNQYGVAQY